MFGRGKAPLVPTSSSLPHDCHLRLLNRLGILSSTSVRSYNSSPRPSLRAIALPHLPSPAQFASSTTSPEGTRTSVQGGQTSERIAGVAGTSSLPLFALPASPLVPLRQLTPLRLHSAEPWPTFFTTLDLRHPVSSTAGLPNLNHPSRRLRGCVTPLPRKHAHLPLPTTSSCPLYHTDSTTSSLPLLTTPTNALSSLHPRPPPTSLPNPALNLRRSSAPLAATRSRSTNLESMSAGRSNRSISSSHCRDARIGGSRTI